VPDIIDNCPDDANKSEPGLCGCGSDDDSADGDSDGVIDCMDNCPAIANADQADTDANGTGDACEPDGLSALSTSTCGCGSGMDGLMIMPLTLLSLGWMRRRNSAKDNSTGA